MSLRWGRRLLAYATCTAVLVLFWLVLSGIYKTFLVVSGIICAVLIVLLARRMKILDREGHPIHLIPNAITYWPWLIVEIFKSAWDVTKVIVHPRLPIDPQVMRVSASQKTSVGVVTYANSITLTPGTISMQVDDGEILVHALTEDTAAGLETGEMDRRVSRFEGSH